MKAFIIFIITLGFIFYTGIFTVLFFFGAGERGAKKPIRIIAMVTALAALAFMAKAIAYLFENGCPL